ADDPGSASQPRGQNRCGVDRKGESRTWLHHIRFRRHWILDAPCDGAVREDGRNPDDPRPLQGFGEFLYRSVGRTGFAVDGYQPASSAARAHLRIACTGYGVGYALAGTA